MQQTKVKPLECAVYLQKSKNMARKDLLLACTMVLQIWETEEIPQDWKDAIIVLEFIKKCLKDCGNYQGISLLSMARKILVRIFLITPNDLLSPAVTREVYSAQYAPVYRFHSASNGAMGRVETRPRGTTGTRLGVGHRANDHSP